ncbi:MAG: tetratricopeptide repeat protein [Alphaproteobacteria bacterium]|nr:tetratricopeptide repeat protein [Alphaproteobacteria bacterium]MDX5414782.1 tetratricopeptide repeat protein [Alphaproteobacteria bacterium]MDX5491963.1 tetratricopeptide repeat protein [Alphaproteobacteria bacterium]
MMSSDAARIGGAPLLRLTRALALAALVAALGGCAGTGGFPVFSEQRVESPFGAYLAGRHAATMNDAAKAALYYERALSDQPGDPVILDRAFMAALTAGDMERAIPLARRLVEIVPDERMARLTLALAALRDGRYADASSEMDAAAPGPFTALVGTLTYAWAAVGEGDKEKALEKIAAFEGRSAFALFRAYHEALMLDVLGDRKGAAKAYEKAMETSGGGSIRVVQAYASFAAREGRRDEARNVLMSFLDMSGEHPLAEYELRRLDAGEPLPPLVTNAREGVAEALYGLGSALAGDTSSNLAELYLNLALFMRPDFDIARSLLGGAHEAQERWADAVAAYDRIGKASPLYLNARIQTGMALDKLDREQDADRVLRRLARDYPDRIEPLVALGDIHRGKEKYAEAAAEYERAIMLAGEPAERDWTLYYARGICFERLGEWEKAEKDLTLALELSGEHPLVLNYLGYSWIEQHHRLDEALAMIEKAVEQRPNDGYIVDSLGWARYRLGEYDLAVKYLERAVELQPGDPTINEHLGDAFWKVGRRIEARYQWSHALSLEPEPRREKILRAKLDLGLEAGEKAEQEARALPQTGS